MAKKDAKTETEAPAINPIETLSIEVKELRQRATRLEEENEGLRRDADTLQASLRLAHQAVSDAEARAREAPATALKAFGGELLITMRSDRRIGDTHLAKGAVVGVLRLQHGVGVDFLADGLRNGVLAPEPVKITPPAESTPPPPEAPAGSGTEPPATDPLTPPA